MLRVMFRAIRDFFRVNFFTGLFIAVPFAVTVVFLVWVWSKIHTPLKQIFSITITQEQMPWSEIGQAIEAANYGLLVVPLISLALVLTSVLVLGIVARSIIGRIALTGLERVVEHLPVIGMLYTSLKQLAEAFMSQDGTSKFQRAVAVQFPYKGVWAIGFVTGNAANIQKMSAIEPYPGPVLTVFVPTTPLPTQGFTLLVPEEDTRRLDMSVPDALKLVVSGGMISTGDSHRHKTAELEKALAKAPVLSVKTSSEAAK